MGNETIWESASTETVVDLASSDSNATIVNAPTNQETRTDEQVGEYIPTEEEIKSLGWRLYTSKEQELRSALHMEYLECYLSENLIPKGLELKLAPSIQDPEFKKKWNTILINSSRELMKLLIEHHANKLQDTLKERNKLSQEMDCIWDKDEKVSFIKALDETIEPFEEELRETKDAKLERDRRRKRREEINSTRERKPPSTVKYVDLVKKHIKEHKTKPHGKGSSNAAEKADHMPRNKNPKPNKDYKQPYNAQNKSTEGDNTAVPWRMENSTRNIDRKESATQVETSHGRTCYFFMKGICKYGNKCFNYHPRTSTTTERRSNTTYRSRTEDGKPTERRDFQRGNHPTDREGERTKDGRKISRTEDGKPTERRDFQWGNHPTDRGGERTRDGRKRY
jgi:hypothetical protein